MGRSDVKSLRSLAMNMYVLLTGMLGALPGSYVRTMTSVLPMRSMLACVLGRAFVGDLPIGRIANHRIRIARAQFEKDIAKIRSGVMGEG